MPTCSRCGTANGEEARFCHACGAELTAQPAGREERKLVSALFVDLVGSTARAEQEDPEELRDALRLYFDCAKSEIERYGGTVEKFIGDAVVAIFGAPIARGDDADRAVRAGLRVLGAIGELNARQPGLELEVRAAVNTGEAIVSVQARPELGDAFAVGDVINTASRLQNAAPPGRLIVGAETYRATRRTIRYEALAPIAAKGKRAAVEAWLALEPFGGAAERSPLTAPFVGRDRELDQLTSIWRRVADDRRPHVATVLGHPGLGKSRITAEFVAHVERGEGGRVISGRCLPYAEQTGYRASADQVKSVAGILDTDPPQEARAKLAHAVTSLLPLEETADISRYLSLLLGLGLDEPTDDRLPLFFAVRRLMEGLSSERPIVLVFEDLHWADESQLDLLEYLSTHVRDVPVLFLVLARPELLDVRPTWGAGHLAQTTIPLEPLAAADAATIATHVLGRTAVDTPLGPLVEAAAGNPLFVEELAAALSEGGGAPGGLPATVREAIASRIDLLPTDQRAVLLDASVIGKTFWRGVLEAIRGVDGVDEHLNALEGRDLVRRAPTSRLEGDVEFSFKHMLIREVAYATLPRAVRRERHGAVARFVEESASDNVRDVAWLLAHHWREAGEKARAVEYLLQAADRAKEAFAKDEAIRLFDEAHSLVEEADPRRRSRIRLLKAVTLVDLGDFEQGAAEIDEILPELGGRDELEALLARARCAVWLEEGDFGFAFSERAVELAEALGDRELLAPAIGHRSGSYIMQGDLDRAQSDVARALELWVPNTRAADLAAVKEFYMEVYYWIGDYPTSEELSRSVFELGDEIHSIEPLLRGGGWFGLTIAAMGRTEEALDLHDSIIRRAGDLGAPRWAASTLNYSSLPLRDLFLVDEARRRNQEALDLVEAHGEWGMPRLQGEIDLLLADLMDGEVGRAQSRWPTLWDAAINGKSWRPWLGGLRLALVRAEIALRAEGPDPAVEWARETITRAGQTRRRKYEMGGRTVLARALLELGRPEEAVAELRSAVEIADQLGTPTHRWETRATLGGALTAVGSDVGAETALREAKDVIDTWAATLSAEHAASLRAAEPVLEVLKAGG